MLYVDCYKKYLHNKTFFVLLQKADADVDLLLCEIFYVFMNSIAFYMRLS